MDLRPHTQSITPSSAILPSLPPSKAAPLTPVAKPIVSPAGASKAVVVVSPPPALEKVVRVPPKAVNKGNAIVVGDPASFRAKWPDDEISNPVPGAEVVVTKPATTAPILEPLEKKGIKDNKKTYILDSQCMYVISLKEYRQGDLISPHPDTNRVIGAYNYANVMLLKGKNLADKLLNEVILYGDNFLTDHLLKGIEEKTIVVRTVYPSAEDRTKVFTIYVSDTKGQFGTYRVFTVQRIQHNTMLSKV